MVETSPSGLPPAELHVDVEVDGEAVLLTFGVPIKFVRFEPIDAINYAQAIIDAAVKARDNAMPIVVPARRLPGIPH